jgi:hypothetical protein
MTIEESQELRKIMKKWGYRIETFNDPLEWCAKIPTDRDGRFGYGIAIVDCSYEDMTYIKYRNRLTGEKELYVMKELKDCSMQEIFSNIGPLNIIKKILIEKDRIASLKEDF